MSIKKYINKIYSSPLFPILVFTILMMTAAFFMHINFGDDELNEQLIAEKNFIELMKYAYNYNKKIFIRYYYSIFYCFIRKVGNDRLWRPALALCYVIIVSTIPNIFTTEKELLDMRNDYSITCSLLFLIPLSIMNETGWLSTSSVYVTPIAVTLLGCIGIKKAYFGEESVKWYDYLIWPITLWIGTAHEQIAPLIAGMQALLLIYSLKNKKNKFLQFILFFIPIIQSYRAFTFPGNQSRRNYEAETFFPNYFSLDIIDKFYLAFIDTMKVIITQKFTLLLLLSFLLLLIIWKKYTDTLYRVISIVPACIIIVLGIKPQILSSLTTYSTSIIFTQTINSSNFTNISIYIDLVLSFSLLFSITISLYLIWGNTFKSLFYIFLFWGGLFTRFIMGMSASLYASAHRTFFILFICLIIITLALIRTLRTLITRKYVDILKIIILTLGMIGYIDFLVYI